MQRIQTNKALVFEDLNYLKCRELIEKAKLMELESNYAKAKDLYEESVKMYPGSVQANQSFAQLVHRFVASEEELKKVEQLYYAALEAMPNFINMQTGKLIVSERSKYYETCMDEQQAICLAQDKLGLLLCQSQGRENDANEFLRNLGFEYKLANEVLNYSDPIDSNNICDNNNKDEKDVSEKYFKIVDNVLNDHLLFHLQECFHANSVFWSDHCYGTSKTGYFSYLYDLKENPCNTIEMMIKQLFTNVVATHYPEIKDQVNFVEWWVHSRPHTTGHQLHYDSDDEGRNGLRHPLLSSVLFVNGSVGGPTLMTNQTLKGERLATKGWLSYPKTNRYVMFDGNVLHGVIPGKGYKDNCDARRMTLMAAFWPNIECRKNNPDLSPGSSHAFPTKLTHPHYNWMDLFKLENLNHHDKNDKSKATCTSGGNGIDSTGNFVSDKNKCNNSIKEHDDTENILYKPPLSRPIPVKNVWEPLTKGKIVPKTFLPHYDTCFQGF